MLLQIEDAALLWMYTSDLLKVWIELYTLYLLFLVKYGVKGATLQVYFLSMFSVFAEVAQVNAEALNIKSYQPRQKHCRGSAEANLFSYGYLSILFVAAKNTEIQGLKQYHPVVPRHHLDSPSQKHNKTGWNFLESGACKQNYLKNVKVQL